MEEILTDCVRLRNGALYGVIYKREVGIEYARYAKPPLLANEAVYLVKGRPTEMYLRSLEK